MNLDINYPRSMILWCNCEPCFFYTIKNIFLKEYFTARATNQSYSIKYMFNWLQSKAH